MAFRDSLLDALNAMRAGVARVDLGDMTRTDVPARIAAVESLAKRAPEPIDDWGWKGGKPGELTGIDYFGAYADGDPVTMDLVTKQFRDAMKRGNETGKAWERMVEAQLEDNPFIRTAVAQERATYDMMAKIRLLEKADVPRKWTGKLANVLPDSVTYAPNPSYFLEISDAMRGLTNPQREDFVRMFPRTKVSPSRLAETVKRLGS